MWLDADADGLQDSDEPTVGGVSVALLDRDGNVVSTQLTHEQFGYIFPRLPAGEYRVQFTAPQGFAFTTPNVGGDDFLDSDADTATGLTPVIRLAEGRIDLSVDAGLVPL